MIASFTGWHGWDWQGWEALVAIGTLALAAATLALALSTRRSVRQQVAETIANNRPVLTVVENIMFGDDTNQLVMTDDAIWLSVENCGPGPALGTVVTLQFAPGMSTPSPAPETIGGAIAPGRLARVRFDADARGAYPSGTKGVLTYTDVAGLRYKTLFEITRHGTRGAVVVSQEPQRA